MRNGLIDLYRFLFVIIICFMHFFTNYYGTLFSKYIMGGYLPVEFFFILSGFLLAKRISETIYYSKNTWDFFLKKIHQFYPIYIFSLVSTILITSILHDGFSLEPINILLEVIMLSAFYGPINPPSWFLGVLILLLPIIHYLIKRYDKLFYMLAPYLVLLIYINLLYQFGLLDVWHQQYGILTAGLYRGLAGLLLGCLSYKLYCKIHYTGKTKYTLLVELSVFLILLKTCLGTARTPNDYIVPILFSVLIITAFLPQSVIINKLNNNFIYYLGKLSLSIFLNHWIIFQVLFTYYKNLDLKFLLVIYLVSICIWGIIALKITNLMFRRLFR